MVEEESAEEFTLQKLRGHRGHHESFNGLTMAPAVLEAWKQPWLSRRELPTLEDAGRSPRFPMMPIRASLPPTARARALVLRLPKGSLQNHVMPRQGLRASHSQLECRSDEL